VIVEAKMETIGSNNTGNPNFRFTFKVRRDACHILSRLIGWLPSHEPAAAAGIQALTPGRIVR
jgi:hypothetical protein